MNKINLSCPMPENINPLSPNGFMFQIQKLPSLTYFCQRVNLPAISLPSAEQATPFVNIPHKGEILEYSDLTVEFLIDSRMENYKAINQWMTDGFPDNEPPEDIFSDGHLHVLDIHNQVIQTIQFVNIVPISLEGMMFESTSSDVQYLVGSATFKYTYYKFV